MSLDIFEIYPCIQGESTQAGRPMTLVRLAECDLRCIWCDTPDAFERGKRMEIPEIVSQVKSHAWPLVLVTGGEPLLQPEAPALISALLDAGFEIMLETGGHRDIGPVDPRVRRILDIKCPGSGMERSNRWENLAELTPRDEVKFVLADRRDYDYAKEVLGRLPAGVEALFSPVHGVLDPKDLAGWILDDRLQVRLHLQLHKYVFGADTRGV